MAYDAAKGNFRVALAGDCMLTRRLSVFDEPAFLALRDLFRTRARRASPAAPI
jgi:hypothetical protein